MKKAELYEKRGNGIVRCTCCRHYCVIRPGQSGICGVRENKDGDLYLRVYGKAIAVHTDPIEKKPLFHFMPASDVFSFGTIGCNFRCKFCQNWDISQATAKVKEMYKDDRDKQELVLGEICDEGQTLYPEKIVEYCKKNKIEIIAYTYTEPTIFTEYAADTAKLAKKEGIKNVYVSNGYESIECLDYIKDWCDAINIDIKSFSDIFYSKICQANLSDVLDTVKEAYKRGIWIECTTLIIPGENDGDAELKGIADFISSVSQDIPWHVTAFHPDYKMNNCKATSASMLERAREIGMDAGLKYVYSGNMVGMASENTVCPKCGELLIERVGLICMGSKINVDKGVGKCFNCGEIIPGVWF